MNAARLVAELSDVMSTIIGVLEEETALVRAGRLNEAAKLERTKTDLAQQYYAGAGRLKAILADPSALDPEARAVIQHKHNEFRALLQLNLTVLATAHAVSEGIMRGVSDELARKSAPSTYGATGRANVPGAGAAQPLTVSRVL